jgi:hypothetical protein
MVQKETECLGGLTMKLVTSGTNEKIVTNTPPIGQTPLGIEPI